MISVAIAIIVIALGGRGLLHARDRRLVAAGCPRCGGRLSTRRPVFGCPSCHTLWTTSGLELVLLREAPVGLLPQPDDVPRAELRPRDKR